MRPARGTEARLRAWLEYVVQTGIDMLDDLDAAEADREPDGEDEVASEDDRPCLGRAA